MSLNSSHFLAPFQLPDASSLPSNLKNLDCQACEGRVLQTDPGAIDHPLGLLAGGFLPK